MFFYNVFLNLNMYFLLLEVACNPMHFQEPDRTVGTGTGLKSETKKKKNSGPDWV